MINEEWDLLLHEEYQKPYFSNLIAFLHKEYKNTTVYPKPGDIFNAFTATPFHEIKVVIIGQDPYQTPKFAHGLAFSVTKGVETPKSLVNIYKELNSDLGCYIPNNGNLEKWAKEGVFLLNTILTVREGASNSHRGLGWEQFTDRVIQIINAQMDYCVFILWGNYARQKKTFITNPNHLIIESAHPSPLSAFNGFYGSKPFSRTNQYLTDHGFKPIDWQIENI